jgi:hypothetical protein
LEDCVTVWKVVLLTLFMTFVASGTYFGLLIWFDASQAAAGACFMSVAAPLFAYRRSKTHLGRFLTLSQVTILLITAAIAGIIPYFKPKAEYLFPVWFFLGIVGMNILVWLIFRVRKNGARLTPGEVEKQKELWRQYADLEVDIQEELELMKGARKTRLERIARYVRGTKDEIERLIREHEADPSLRPPPALGSDPSAPSIPPAPRAPSRINGKTI